MVATSRASSAQIVRLAHARHEVLGVVAQLRNHVVGVDEVGVVVLDALQARDVADRAQRRAADLAHALGDLVGHGEQLVALLVEQEVIDRESAARLTCQWKFLVLR